MKDLALAVLWVSVPLVSVIAALPEQQVSDPEWIAIFELKRDETKEPLLNMRVVIHAKTEGEAVMKSTIYLQTKFGVNVTDSLQFVEVARRDSKK